MGCVIQAAQGQNVARQASIKAGTPNRSSGNHNQRCMWFWFEMCQ